MSKWEAFLEPKEPKPKSFKQKLDKNRFCRKNVMGPKTFGGHIYNGTTECSLCGHIKKARYDKYR